MSDLLGTWGAYAVVTIQISVPPLLAWRAWYVEDPRRSKAAERSRGTAKGRSARGFAHDQGTGSANVALSCTQCASPVPLLASTFPCHACGTLITPPAEYADALRAASETERTLLRAERVWSWSRVWTSVPVIWLGRLMLLAWLVLVLASAVVLWGTWMAALVPAAAIVAIVQVFVGLALLAALRDMRFRIPPLPPRAQLHAPPELAECAGCGSPLAFARDRFSAVCGYCTGVQYRLALADQARSGATRAAIQAQLNLLDGVRALDEKRFELAGATVITGIAVVFYVVLFGLGWLLDL